MTSRTSIDSAPAVQLCSAAASNDRSDGMNDTIDSFDITSDSPHVHAVTNLPPYIVCSLFDQADLP